MNNVLYDEIVANGLGLSSPSIALADDSIAHLKHVNSELDSLPPTIPEDWIDGAKAPINETIVDLSSAQLTMQSKCNNVFSIITTSSTVNRIEGTTGCGDLSNITGSIMGEADPMINGVSQIAQAQARLITQFHEGSISAIEFMAEFDELGSSYQDYTAQMSNLFDKEDNWLTGMINKVTSNSLTTSVALLWNDPCAQSVLDNTLSPRVIDILNQGGV